MNELISRQKLIEELKNWQGDIHDNEYDASEHDFVFERIYEIITDQPPADQWIPCSERPPEEPCIYTVEDCSPYTVNKHGEPKRRTIILKPFTWEPYHRVIAWKPINIEPYKGAE